MLDDFFTRALLAGIGVALIAGPFGCFIVWRRMAYFGDTLAHSGLLGVALGFALQWNISLSVFLISLLVSMLLLISQRQKIIASDAILGLLSHTALAVGLVALAFMDWLRVDLMAFLFGDILAVTKLDLLMVYGGGAVLLGTLIAIWRPLFATTVSEELARAEGINVLLVNTVFMVLMAVVIAISMKLVGVLLITALLIIPASTARHFAAGPEAMGLLAALSGVVAVCGGLSASLIWDTPSGPSIVVVAALLFLVSVIFAPMIKRGRARV